MYDILPKPTTHFKYEDFISYCVFVILLPIVILEIIIYLPFVSIYIFLSYIHKESRVVERNLRKISYWTTHLKKYIGWTFCIFLCDTSQILLRYRTNFKFMKMMNTTTNFNGVEYQNVIEKEGFLKFLFKNIIMWSLLPVIKYILIDNPLLFDMRISSINRHTRGIQNPSLKNLKTINYIVRKYTKRSINNTFSNGLDYVSVWCLNFTTVYSFVEFRKNKRFILDYKSLIMNDEFKRCGVNCLRIPLNNPWHLISGYAEINIRDNGSVEYPIVGIFTSSILSQYRWEAIDYFFQNKICKRVESRIGKHGIQFRV